MAELYSLTNPQKSIWLIEKYFKNTSINNICGTVEINDPINFDILSKSINLFIKNNTSFRIHIKLDETNNPLQYVADYQESSFDILELSSRDSLIKLQNSVVKNPFPILDSDLFKIILFKYSNGTGGFITVAHHLIGDSWTSGILANNIMSTYYKLLDNSLDSVPSSNYIDYVKTETEYLNSDKYNKDKEYWLNNFENSPEVVSISPNINTIELNCEAHRSSYYFNIKIVKQINEFCKSHKISVFNFLIAVYSIYISNITNSSNFVIGTPVLNRTNFVEKNISGMFISNVPLSINLDSTKNFVDFAKGIGVKTLSALRHQRFPYQKILEELRTKTPDLPNLYNIVLSYQITKTDVNNLPYKCSWNFNGCCSDELQIHIADYNESGKLEVMYDYQKNKFSSVEIKNIHNRITNIILQIFENENINLEDIEIVTNEEKNEILLELTKTRISLPKSVSVKDNFEKIVLKYPTYTALTYNNESITYTELNERANILANTLISKDIRNKNICVFMPKSIDYIVALLGIIKSNNTIVPISTSYPMNRVNYIIEDCNASILITNNKIDSFTNSKVQILELTSLNKTKINILNPITSKALAPVYTIYTSGSTGNPKGVIISNKSLTNHICAINDRFNNNITSIDSCLSIANLSFDACMQEIFIAILNGANLHLLSDECIYDPKYIANYIDCKNITMAFIPPTILDSIFSLLAPIKNLSINKLLVGVQSIFNTTINNLLTLNPNMQVHNGYGPTEATICCISKIFNKKVNDKKQYVSIGKPMGNCKVYILNKYNNLLPVGYKGEICIGGSCLADGYLNLPEKTKNSFVKIKKLNEFLYKTGDIAYVKDNYELQYIGRIDSQVKIHGFRIEIGEIDNTVSSYESNLISHTIVYDNSKLFTFIVTKNQNIDLNNLRSFLKEKLPYYMIPNKIFIMDNLPINSNGKTDEKSLIQYAIKNIQETTDVLHASNDFEQKISELICETLDYDCKPSDIDFNQSFIELGGDSLSAIELSTIISKELNKDITVKDILASENLLKLCEIINNTVSNIVDSQIVKIQNKENIYEISSAERRIYLSNQMIGKDSIVYNTPGALLFDSILDKEKIINAFQNVVDKNSVFRTQFIIENDTIKQQILDSISVTVPFHEDTESNIDNILKTFTKPFDLSKAPLLRVSIYYLDNKKTLLLFDSHHIIMDGVSLNILIKQFFDLYNGKNIRRTKIDYKDYSVWERNYNYEENQKYWLKRFKDYNYESLNLPYDYTIPANRSYVGDKIFTTINDSLFNKIKKISKKLKISTYSIFLGALFITLYKYTGQDDLVIGSPVANRLNNDLSNIIGNFVNNIAIRNKILANQTIDNYLTYLNNLLIEDVSNQSYPYDRLIKDLHLPNDSSKNQLFDLVFTYQNQNNKLSVPDIELNMIELKDHIAKFNMTVEVVPKTKNLNIEYRTDLFKEETIKNFIEHYNFVLEQISDNTNDVIENINIITPEEQVKLNRFNNTSEPINHIYAAQLFEEQVKAHPDNIALICNDQSLTYFELNKYANSLAHYLLKQGLKPNDIVAIVSNRSLETIVCMIAILKAGGAFLNIDPTYPIERTEYYIENSNIQFVLAQQELESKVKKLKNIIYMDLSNNDIYNTNFKNPNVKIEDDDLSYIIYTSGSTGKPKGVMLNQLGLSNMIQSMKKCLKYLEGGNNHCLVSVTSTPFDIFVYEIMVSLGHGLRVVMANNAEHRNPKLLDALIKKYNVDVMTVTPSLMKINYDNREPNTALANVKNMVFGGEPLPEKFVEDLRALADDIKIYNIYGPSEITVLSNVQDLDGESEITVGPPIMNTQEYILDKNMNQVPIGVVGEIYIAGIQVGKGYMNRPELTAEKFLDNPFGSGKIYKSGDIGRWTFDGKIQCLGRIDNQIKLRGLRIELGEIENIISKIPSITSSIINKIEMDGKESLCAYYVTTGNVTEKQVRDEMKKYLPQYMIPTYIMKLEKMPYTINRKIDRKALPLPTILKEVDSNIININELGSNEDKLIQIWKNILNIPDINTDDNFFEIGGDSILAIKMQIEALKCGIQFEYSDIFNYPTIKQLSKKIPDIQKKNFDNYDFSNINKLISNNDENNLNNITKFNFKNILLVGSTGYLGAHIANEFLTNYSGDLYCLVREKDKMTIFERLTEILDFYFGKGYFKKYESRIKLINGDISGNDLSISSEDEKLLSENIDAVINSAALVKHYGLKDKFESINVQGTKNIIDFCKKYNKRLIHISTISVSGFGEKEEIAKKTEEIATLNFTEKDIYVGQNIKGVYSTTKLKSEILVLNAILDGLDAQILRMGNITNRFSDGVFQKNIDNNAFVKRIKSFIEIGAFPQEFLNGQVELTPVDLAAQATLKILEYNSPCNIFHIYNPNLLAVKDIYLTLTNRNYSLVPVNSNLMTNIITGILENDSQKQKIEGLIQDLSKDKTFNYSSKINLTNNFSTKYLEKINFIWPKYSAEYLNKCFDYYEKIKYIIK